MIGLPFYLCHWLWNTTDGTSDASFGHMGSGATDGKQEKGDVLIHAWSGLTWARIEQEDVG